MPLQCSCDDGRRLARHHFGALAAFGDRLASALDAIVWTLFALCLLPELAHLGRREVALVSPVDFMTKTRPAQTGAWPRGPLRSIRSQQRVPEPARRADEPGVEADEDQRAPQCKLEVSSVVGAQTVS